MSFRFNPLTGKLDLDTQPTGTGNGEIVTKDFTAGEDISALRMVKHDDPTTVSLADKDLLMDAQTIGIATNAALTGGTVSVVTFGQVDDNSFTFAPNTCLFLGDDGAITDIPPTTGHNVPIGKGLGIGSIFIDIDNITIL